MQSFDASKYRGKKIKLSAYLKTKDVTGWSCMWMRVDGAQRMLGAREYAGSTPDRNERVGTL